MDISKIKPATDSEVAAVLKHIEEHGEIRAAYVLALIARVKQQDQEMETHQAFYKLTVKERDYERVRNDRLTQELEACIQSCNCLKMKPKDDA